VFSQAPLVGAGAAGTVSSPIMPASRHPGAPPVLSPVRKQLHTIDAGLTAASPVSDIAELTAVAVAAVRAGGGRVLDASHVSFANGAVTLVLILAESHLAIHTWPEEDLIAIDLFSCGAIDAQRVAAELVTALKLAGVHTQRVERGARGPGGSSGGD
jgi:S-adenosylmethionine decarboxylase